MFSLPKCSYSSKCKFRNKRFLTLQFKKPNQICLHLELSSVASHDTFSREDDISCLEVKPEEFPECSENQIVFFNQFAQPVCYCNSESYPLNDPNQFTSDQASLKQCYKIGDQGPCSDYEDLQLTEASEDRRLSCSSQFDAVGLAFPGGFTTALCLAHQVYIFRRCVDGYKG